MNNKFHFTTEKKTWKTLISNFKRLNDKQYTTNFLTLWPRKTTHLYVKTTLDVLNSYTFTTLIKACVPKKVTMLDLYDNRYCDDCEALAPRRTLFFCCDTLSTQHEDSEGKLFRCTYPKEKETFLHARLPWKLKPALFSAGAVHSQHGDLKGLE